MMMLLIRFKIAVILYLYIFVNFVQSQVLCEAASSVNMDIDLSGLKPPKGGWSDDVVVKLSSSKYPDVCKVRVVDMVKAKAPCRVPIKYIKNGRNEFAMIIYSVVSGHVYANMDASFHVDDETAFVKAWDIGDIGLKEALLGVATVSALSGLATLLWINQVRLRLLSDLFYHTVSSFSGPKPPKPGPTSVTSDSTPSPTPASSVSSTSSLATSLSFLFRGLSEFSRSVLIPIRNAKVSGSAVAKHISRSRQLLVGIAGLLLVVKGRPSSLPTLNVPGYSLAPVGQALRSTSSAVLRGFVSAPSTVVGVTKTGLKTAGDVTTTLGGVTLGGVKTVGGALGSTLGAITGLLRPKQIDAHRVSTFDTGLASSDRGYSEYTRSKRPSRPASHSFTSKGPLLKVVGSSNSAARRRLQQQSNKLPLMNFFGDGGTLRARERKQRASSAAKPHSRDHNARFSLDREFGVSVKDSDISYFLTKEEGARGASISTLQTMTNLVWAFLSKKIVSVIMGEKAPT